MKTFAVGRLLLDGCMAGLVGWGSLQAAPLPDTVIGTPGEAHAFTDAAPFLFSGQSLIVNWGFATDRAIELQSLAPIIVGPAQHFELRGEVSSAATPLTAPLEKRGLGTLLLSAANTYTSNTVLREGTLHVAGDSALGSHIYSLEQHAGTVLKLAPGARVVNFLQLTDRRAGDAPLPGLDGRVEWRVDSGQATLANNMTALVPIRKAGDGGLRLTGVVHGGQTLHVDQGALVLDGTASGLVEVGPGARLEGIGSFAAARIRGGGMLAPGGRLAVGTLASWGDVVFEPGSRYHVDVYPDGRSDQLHLLGRADLAGRVWAEAGSGAWMPEHRYPILIAGAGLNGTAFDGVDANLAFLDPYLEYEPDRVYLVLRRNEREIGETPEDGDVGDAIDTLPLTPLKRALLNVTPEQAQAALRSLSGSWHGSVRSFLFEDSRHVRDAVLASGWGLERQDVWERAAKPAGLRSWSHAYVAGGDRAAVSGVAGDTHTGRGLILGLDAPVGEGWRLGGLLAAQHARLKRTGEMATASLDSRHVGLTANGRWDGMRVTVGLLHAWHRIESRRQASAGPLRNLLSATYSGRSWQSVLELAPQLRRFKHMEAGPFLRHAWMRLRVSGFQESGGPAAHEVFASNAGMHAVTLGGRLYHAWERGGVHAEVGWRRVLGERGMASTQRFAGDDAAAAVSPAFTSYGLPLQRDALALSIGADTAPARHARLSARYAGLLGRDLRSHSAWAELQIAW